MADNLLTGLLTGVFALGGVGITMLATSRREAVQERRDAKKRREDKFQEMVSAVYEFDQWVQNHMHATVDRMPVPQTTSPIVKVSAISSVYFPQFDELISDMEVASVMYLNSILGKDLKQEYIYLYDKERGTLAAEYWMDLGKKRTALTRALKNFAQEHFQ